jgi:hypothetical protein
VFGNVRTNSAYAAHQAASSPGRLVCASVQQCHSSRGLWQLISPWAFEM